jgi:tetratricopeptide (TPR) repeat protein
MATTISVMLAVALAVAPAPETSTARKLFDAGSLAYDRGRYGDATRAFSAAYELLPDPAIAFSLAQAHRRQYFAARDPADLVRAIELFRRYLDDVPDGGRRADAVDQLQALESVRSRLEDDGHVAPARASAPSTELVIYAKASRAEVSIDDGAFVAVPAIFEATPGPHRIVVQAPGFVPEAATATAIDGRLMPFEVSLKEQPAVLHLRTRRGAAIAVDGRDIGRAPLREPIALASGRHAVSITAPGRVSATRTIELDRGQVRTFSVGLPRTVQRDAAWAMLGTSAGLWLAGGTTLGLALGFQRRGRRIDALRGERNIDASELQTLETSIRHRDQLRGATIGLWSGAAVAAVIGLVLIFTDRG